MSLKHLFSIKMKTRHRCKKPLHARFPQKKLTLKMVFTVFLLILTGILAQEAYLHMCDSEFFQITALKIEGNRMAGKEEITALSRVDIHSNLLAIKAGQVKSLLKSHPWIEEAAVKRDWPNRLLISIKEKKPVALLNRENGLFYLDRHGQIIAAAAQNQELDFPVITGLENFPFNGEASPQTPGALRDAIALLKLASKNNSILPEQNISEIHLAENRQILLYLLERAFPIYMGSEGDISTRYYRLVRVLKDLYSTKEFSSVSYIRLDYQKDTILVGKSKSSGRHQG